jgi:hypothetical protein
MVPRQDFVFEGREERLRSGVIETLTGPAHRLGHSERSAQRRESRCSVGRPAISVKPNSA